MKKQITQEVSTRLGARDILGRWRVRWAVGRNNYRVSPGLYRVGDPDPASPVLVTANYKLTFDVLRSELGGVDAWILVLDTKGVNVWCAAGKGTFSTDELVRCVRSTDLPGVVTHRRLIVPQLGATGVAAHEVRRICGFKVIYGPVRARDIKAFLAAGEHASDDMRRVTFTLGERFVLVGAELGPVLKWFTLLTLAALLLERTGTLSAGPGSLALVSAPVIAGLLTGTVLVPVLLPWIPGRAFSFKGALSGAVVVGIAIFLTPAVHSALGKVQVFLLGTAAASFFAMQFTGSTTYTSPSGVEWEMRRALVFHIGAVLLAFGLGVMKYLLG